ncbi:hypothetical protein CPLU01_13590 [Colletotrichum plurivorum]|uniref:Uncharacterized protein n=1 Tax=Colletotrichum plurivorum TaxID=2175906 RepID=A0A8H6JQ88_9PEZI|nr:hypothetical protein CPLU01_13590 [Colletotrichum plurivorum]
MTGEEIAYSLALNSALRGAFMTTFTVIRSLPRDALLRNTTLSRAVPALHRTPGNDDRLGRRLQQHAGSARSSRRQPRILYRIECLLVGAGWLNKFGRFKTVVGGCNVGEEMSLDTSFGRLTRVATAASRETGNPGSMRSVIILGCEVRFDDTQRAAGCLERLRIEVQDGPGKAVSRDQDVCRIPCCIADALSFETAARKAVKITITPCRSRPSRTTDARMR